MAFRSKTRTSRRRTTKVDVRWATPSMILDQTVLLGSTLSATLLTDSDFNALLGFERVRLERIKGWLCFYPANGTVRGGVFCSIFKVAGGTTPDPTLGASYDNNDLLWSGGAGFATTSSTPGSVGIPQVVDVRTRRLMTSEDSITAQFRATGGVGTACLVTGMLRCLWSYK